MKAFIALFAVLAVANAGLITAPAATYISRAPAFDSAVIKSDRLGGNFAYSVAENHAYAAHTPIVQNVVTPVVSYSAGAPVAYTTAHHHAAPVAYAAAAPIATYGAHAYGAHAYGALPYAAHHGFGYASVL